MPAQLTRSINTAATIVIFGSTIAAIAPAAAQNVVYDPVTRAGAAVIDRVIGRPGGFDRCRAIFKGPDGDLIFHFHKERFYSITVPGPKGMTNVPRIALELGGRKQNLKTEPGSGWRIRAKLTTPQVESIMNINGRFVAWVGDQVRQEWAVAKMEDVFVALEDCTFKNAP